MKKKRYIKVLVLVFAAIYVFSMVMATSIAKEEQEYQFFSYRDSAFEILRMYMDSIAEEAANGEVYSEEVIEDYIINAVANVYFGIDDDSQKIAVAVYDEAGNIVTQSTNTLTIYGTGITYAFELDKYFSEEEIQFLKQVYLDYMANAEGTVTPFWRVHAYVNEETMELAKLYFTTEYNFDINEADYETPNTETKWSWINPDKNVHKNLVEVGDTIYRNYQMEFPYLNLGEEAHDEWTNHEFLQEFPEKWTWNFTVKQMSETDVAKLFAEETFKETKYEYDTLMYVGSKEYVFKYRQVFEPWTQTIASLKILYIGSAIFVAVCLAVVINSLNKFYKQREQLEGTRRDFTNAIAHELKTPLGVIRGYAENMLESTNETKRDYYLKQIVGQTEEMDKLVKEMVYISKLDSEDVFVEKERLHIEDIIKEQLKKLEVLSDEKNLDIKLKVHNNLIVNGDKKYLERAIWNLLVNAIEYNHLDGFIKITIDKDQFRIENSGVKIGEDELPHVFDMFYTSDKSRNFSDKHMGLGLYLAKKIFELHNMKIVIANSEVGVEVKVTM